MSYKGKAKMLLTLSNKFQITANTYNDIWVSLRHNFVFDIQIGDNGYMSIKVLYAKQHKGKYSVINLQRVKVV